MKLKTLVLVGGSCAILAMTFGCDASAPAEEEFEATRESLIRYGVPQWYDDAKFGIYLHWGPFSVAAFETEWYPRHMYIEGTDHQKHHLKTWGPLNEFGYKDFIPMLTADKFDPDAYAKLFKEAGARYVAAAAIRTELRRTYGTLDHFEAAFDDLILVDQQMRGSSEDSGVLRTAD